MSTPSVIAADYFCTECRSQIELTTPVVCCDCFVKELETNLYIDQAIDTQIVVAERNVSRVMCMLVYRLEQLGDAMRDNRGDRDGWWTTVRDIVYELRRMDDAA
jgi:hypothetical protein